MRDLIGLSERCPNCLIPLSAPDVFITETGVCNLCREYQPIEIKGKDALRNDLASTDSHSRQYDCLVPISGGLDSVYTAFYLERKMGLNCLGVHYDNGMSSDSKEKMLAWIEKELGMRIVVYSWQKEKSRKLVRNSVRALLDKGPQAMQASLCRHCGYGIRAAVFSEMVRNNLHSVWGKHTMDHIPFRYCVAVSLRQQVLQRHGLDGFRALRGRYQQSKALPSPGSKPLKLLFTPMGYPSLPESHRHLKNLTFFEYIPWNKARMLRELEQDGVDIRELSGFHSDCNLAPMVDRVLQSAWTVGKKEIYISNMLRDRQLSKEEAWQQIQTLHSNNLDTTFLSEIGLTENEIDALFREL
jgi:hypothetical protein